MESVSIARTILVIVAYVFNVFVGLAILAIAIWILGKASSLPDLWMPEWYDSFNSDRKKRLECWKVMTDSEKKHARGERIVTIFGFITLIAVFGLCAYLAIRFLFPAVIELAKNM